MRELNPDIAADPLVSVIVPCYNYGHYLPETLQSVAAQSYSNFECIIVDDGSTDDTKSVAASFAEKDPRFTYIFQENQGLSAARNTGIRLAKGTLIQFLDADDLIHFQKFEIQVRLSEGTVVFSDFQYFENREAASVTKLLQQPLIGPCVSKTISAADALRQMTRANLMVVNAPLVPIECIRASTEFKTSYRSLEDWNYWFRMASRGTTFIQVKCATPLAFVRKHPASMSRQVPIMLAAHGMLVREMTEYFDSLGKEGELLRNALHTARKEFPGSLIFNEIQQGSLSRGLSLAFRSAFKSPGDFYWYLRNSLYSIKVRRPNR